MIEKKRIRKRERSKWIERGQDFLHDMNKPLQQKTQSECPKYEGKTIYKHQRSHWKKMFRYGVIKENSRFLK